MAVNTSILTSLFTDIASAIRSKTGASGTIVADAFPTAIASIPVGYDPSGTLNISANGTYDIASYASINVNTGNNSLFNTWMSNGMSGITISDSTITSVRANGFAFTNVNSINLPNCTNIGSAAFWKTNASQVNLPLITTVPIDAFLEAENLTQVNVQNASSFGSDAFRNAGSATDGIDFGNTSLLTTISPNCFMSCYIKSINLSRLSGTIPSSAFYGVSFMSSTALNLSGVTSIGLTAFRYCITLTNININNVTTIGGAAFQGCSNLVNISADSLTSVGQSVFQGCTALISVSFPGCSSISYAAFSSCTSLISANFTQCTYVGSYAFWHCEKLVDISFPLLTSISSYAFPYDYSLITASFPSLVSIGNYAFRNCTRLTSLYLLGSSVVALGGTSVFYSTPIGGYSTSAGTFGSVYVPASLYDTYISATYWSTISSRIVSV